MEKGQDFIVDLDLVASISPGSIAKEYYVFTEVKIIDLQDTAAYIPAIKFHVFCKAIY